MSPSTARASRRPRFVARKRPHFAIDIPDILARAVDSVDPELRPEGRVLDSGWRQVDRAVASTIAAVAAWDVDLLVTGSHSRGAAGRVLLGSVTSHLIELAKCPVLVVPRPE